MVIAQFERWSRAELPEALPVGKSRNMNRSGDAKTMAGIELGEPLSVYDAARLIGCSPWTVRQTLIPRGLPHFRFKANGRLIFYRDQIIRWIEKHQGGNQ